MPGIQSIDGLMSNLDTTSIVNTIMAYERRGIELMEANKLVKTNQMSVYNAISARLVALKVQATQLKNAAAYDAVTAGVSDDSYLSAVVKGKVSEGQYNIAIEQLASNHQIASQGFESESASIGEGTFTLQVGSSGPVTITIDANNNTLAGLKNAINNANAGVKAAIVDDGSSSNSHRLLLTAENPGAHNEIVITTSLSGGNTPDFENATFDTPETLSWNSASTSTVSLGTGAEYTGNVNKTYTFVVQGSGSKSLGTDPVTIEWSDGDNTGSFEIPADYIPGSEITLTGDGADGLTLSFSQGTLTGGDSFQVQTFAPLLQAASDARISMGGTAQGASPIIVTSSSNMVDNLIPGLTLNLKKITDSQTPRITINTSIDVENIEAKIKSFIEAYNDAMDEINKQFKYNEDTRESGILFGDSTLLTVQNRLRSTMLTNLTAVDGDYRLLSQLGIRFSLLGELRVADSTALREAISENLDDVMKFFTNTANSDNNKITYHSATAHTNMPEEGFSVNITQAATQGYLKGAAIADPSANPIVIDETNYKLKFRVDGMVSDEIALTQRTYNSFAELAAEIQSKIDNDAKIGGRDILVEYFDLGDTGYLQIKSSHYGSDSRVETEAGIDNSAFTVLGLAAGEMARGMDVEGTINGEEAEGKGQILTGKQGNSCSDGLSLKVELQPGDIDADNPEATVTLVKGFAVLIDELLDLYSATGEGVLANRANMLQMQINDIDNRIEREEARLTIREQSLYRQYYALEQSLGEWNSMASYLETQLTNINNNWNYMGRKSQG